MSHFSSNHRLKDFSPAKKTRLVCAELNFGDRGLIFLRAIATHLRSLWLLMALAKMRRTSIGISEKVNKWRAHWDEASRAKTPIARTLMVLGCIIWIKNTTLVAVDRRNVQGYQYFVQTADDHHNNGRTTAIKILDCSARSFIWFYHGSKNGYTCAIFITCHSLKNRGCLSQHM